MRRKTFEVLFEPKSGMLELVVSPCLWRSGWYFFLSVGLFTGVVSNIWFSEMPLSVRFAIIIATVIISGTALSLYGFLLHGILETFGALTGDPKGLICVLGYTTLPFLILTPLALFSGRLGLHGILPLICVVIAGFLWMLYLLVHSLQVVYLIDFARAGVAVLFSLFLLGIVFLLPWKIGFELLLRHIS
ncbi:MAG: YIP1 family protein [Phascolarctobacterium sp.]|nr:YIP1 family protein [Phascolarctobacterium sp.]MCD8175182.1 YIP1 family protein [Phascolarctobacterium sp.]